MCGIAGILNAGADGGRAVGAMIERLRHRGPDGTGSWCGAAGPGGGATAGGAPWGASACALGHARLAIIDLETGRQPMANEDGSVLLVCNGEIYNFRELRARLESRGHRFKTKSDNEVILHLYEDAGPECVKQLDGMFAFALWDARAGRLVLARDRLGEKPLVYYHGDDFSTAAGATIPNRQSAIPNLKSESFFAFASELDSLLALDAIPRVIDPEALHHYLSYLAVPFPLTIYRNVHKLPPAHFLVVERGELTLTRYWDLAPRPEDWSLDDAAGRVRAAVEEAVRSRLVSDVPLGAFLSGGIDSSIVVALMSAMCAEPVRTFSIGFEGGGADYNELEFARLVAERFKTRHTEFRVRPEAVEVLPLLARRYGEPFADPSAIPTYYLAKMTSEHVKVALTGDGGDESFGGYPRHVAARACGQVDRVVPSLGRLVGQLGSLLPKGKDRKSSLTRAKLLLGAMQLSPKQRQAAWLAYSSEHEKRQLYTPAFAERIEGCDSAELFADAYARCAGLGDAATASMYTDLVAYLPNDPLVKMDIATMACGLEARAPLLDHRVVEFAFRIPSRHKLHGGRGKFVLRHAFRDLLPEPVLSRGKMGFGVPIARWLREDLAEFARTTLRRSETVLTEVFAADRIERMLDEHISGRADRAYPIWTLLCFELWAREFRPRLHS